MTTATEAIRTQLSRPAIVGPAWLSVLLFALGLVGVSGAGAGYGLFIVAGLLLLAGLACFAIFVFTRAFDDEGLLGSAKWLMMLGGWGYVLSVAALGGHYTRAALAGRLELKWILFGPAILAAIAVLDAGIYRLLIKKQLPTWRRYNYAVSRHAIEPDTLKRTLVDDVVLHRSLYAVSGFRWLRHTLIFWGFSLMFGIELLAVVFREALPSFGAADVYADFAHPLRAGFEFAFDLTGLMVLVGCAMAIAWRIRVNGTDLQKFTDTPTSVFLFLVVASGFMVEAWRIAAMGRDAALMSSFVGYALSFAFPAGLAGAKGAYNTAWLVHVLGSCAFIAYVPVWRLIHSCATPLGRLMNSQKTMLAKKKEHSLQGLMTRRF